MHHSLRYAVAAVGLLLVAGSATLPAAPAAEVATCDISAWTTDKDPNGLAVRAGPGTGNAVLARLPPPGGVEGYENAAEVTITGSQKRPMKSMSCSITQKV